MRPITQATSFGSITIDGTTFQHDVLIHLDGTIEKRKKKLSKRLYGTSHTISLDEAEYIFEEGVNAVLIGTGQYDQVRLSSEAEAYFAVKGVKVLMLATPMAVSRWNEQDETTIGRFHLTC
jgi:hypothetical protein